MLADNLDPEGTPNARNTLFLYGQITSGLPLSLLLDPSFSPTEITFQVGVGADKASNDIPQTQLFAEDLRQIVEGITIRIPVTLTEYYPGKGFSDDPVPDRHQPEPAQERRTETRHLNRTPL